MVGKWALFARKENGGGIIVTDISTPSAPTYVADVLNGGNGGYVFTTKAMPSGDLVGQSVRPRDLDNITEWVLGILLVTITPASSYS